MICNQDFNMTAKYKVLVILLHYWKAKKSATESYRLICEIEGPDVLKERTAVVIFKNFKMVSQTYEDKKCFQSTITRHLHKIGKVKRKSNEIPHF